MNNAAIEAALGRLNGVAGSPPLLLTGKVQRALWFNDTTTVRLAAAALNVDALDLQSHMVALKKADSSARNK
jgi:hypothetical protein